MSETRERVTVLITPPALPTKPIKLSRDKTILEKDIEEDNRKYALSLGCSFEKFTSPSRRSVPDRLLTCPYGLMAFIEYKAPGKKVTTKQWEDHQDRRERGVLVYVVDNMEEGRKVIDRIVGIRVSCSVEVDANYEWSEKWDNRKFYNSINQVEGM